MSLLETSGLSRRFGGLIAVDNVDLRIEVGDIRAVIGPNGAGKTTLVDLICGRTRATSGRISFYGEDITDLPAFDRVGRGIAYTFQTTSIFGDLSVFDNVALAVQNTMQRQSRSVGRDWRPIRVGDLARRVEAALGEVGLADRKDAPARELPYGHKRLLEVAMGMALQPRLLILDEPTQGLGDEEIARLCDLLRVIASRATILLIEHNMAVVMALATTVTVMERGRILAEGTPAQIRENAAVQRAYLGG